MPKLRIHCFAISIDGYGAGPGQNLDNPLGVGGLALHDWVLPTRTFRAMHGDGGGGTTGVDEMDLVMSPVLLGAGEHLFAGLDLPALGCERVEHAAGEGATHYVLAKRRLRPVPV